MRRDPGSRLGGSVCGRASCQYPFVSRDGQRAGCPIFSGLFARGRMGCHFSYPTPIQLFRGRLAARNFVLLVENCLLLYGLLDERLLEIYLSDIELIKRCLSGTSRR